MAFVMIFIHEAFATDLAHERKLLVMPFYMKLVIVCRTELLVAIVHFTCYFDRCLQINLHKYTIGSSYTKCAEI